jgi:hypothetical protein
MLFAFLDFRRVRRKMPVEAPVDDAPSIRERGRQRQVRSGLKALFKGSLDICNSPANGWVNSNIR